LDSSQLTATPGHAPRDTDAMAELSPELREKLEELDRELEVRRHGW
jgi:hypothetical protein